MEGDPASDRNQKHIDHRNSCDPLWNLCLSAGCLCLCKDGDSGEEPAIHGASCHHDDSGSCDTDSAVCGMGKAGTGGYADPTDRSGHVGKYFHDVFLSAVFKRNSAGIH